MQTTDPVLSKSSRRKKKRKGKRQPDQSILSPVEAIFSEIDEAEESRSDVDPAESSTSSGRKAPLSASNPGKENGCGSGG